MGAQFDRWLAQPSTLHFLRHLIGPQAGLSGRKRPCRGVRWVQSKRKYSTATMQLSVEGTSVEEARNKGSNFQHTQWLLHRAAQELNLVQTMKPQEKGPSTSSGSNQESFSYHEQLRVQTNVNCKVLAGKLLIDQSDNVNNMEAWNRILEFRQRIDGLRGVLDVWEGMRERNVMLPAAGEHGEALWIAFIHSAITEKQDSDQLWLLRKVFQHAQELQRSSGEAFPHLYTAIVGRYLRVAPGPQRSPGPVIEWHQQLFVNGFIKPAMLHQLTLDVLQSTVKTAAFKKFKQIYRDADAHGCYDSCMPLVLQHATEKDAANWHHFFLDQQDAPSDRMASEPAVQLFLHFDKQDEAQSTSNAKGPNRRQVSHALLDKAASSASLPPLTRASMSSLVGDVHGIKAKAISDGFCARMFATSAFSVDFVVRGLVFLNIELLGPMSLREMAVRSKTLRELESFVATVRKAGICLADSMYARILEKVVQTNNVDLFNALLNSDQHPESYNDASVQERLLGTFLEVQDWQQVHLTLLCLSQADRSMVGHAWNCLLRHYINVQHYQEISRVMDYLRSEQIPISGQTLHHLMKEFLPRRVPSKRPVTMSGSGLRPLNFLSLDLVVNACMYQAQRGDYVPSPTWVELLKRYGMAHKFDRVERLALWLVQHYSQHAKGSAAVATVKHLPQALKDPRTEKADKLNRIFTDSMLEAIVTWGWRSASVRDLLRPLMPSMTEDLHRTKYWQSIDGHDSPAWARGILLLRQLKGAGVPVRQDHVRKATRRCLWTLFGPSVSRRSINVEAMHRNRLSPAHYVQTVNELWEEPVFNVSSDMLENSLESETRLLQTIFGPFRLTDRKTGTYADVNKWLAARAGNGGRDRPRSQRARRYRWSVSPYRLHASKVRQHQLAGVPHSEFNDEESTIATHATTTSSRTPTTSISSQQHPQPSAQPSSSHRQPNQLYVPVPP